MEYTATSICITMQMEYHIIIINHRLVTDAGVFQSVTVTRLHRFATIHTLTRSHTIFSECERDVIVPYGSSACRWHFVRSQLASTNIIIFFRPGTNRINNKQT